MNGVTLMALLSAGASILPHEWLEIVRDLGILAVLVFFFTWTGWKREERISKRVTTLEHFVQSELLAAVKISTQALQDNTNALRELVTVLRSRPCLLGQDDVLGRLETIAERLAPPAE